MVLAELMLKRIRPPSGGRIELADSLAPGLVLRVSTSGAKSWSLKYKVPGEGGATSTGRPKKGKSRRLTLGAWPAMSLADAREAAATAGRQAATGADPRRTRYHSAGNTVAVVAAEMVRSAKLTVSTWEKMETCLNKHVIPTLGHRAIAEVSWPDARAASPHSKYGARRTFEDLRARDPQFREQWDNAINASLAKVESEIMRRAMTPTKRPIFSRGELVGEEDVFDNKLLLALARKMSPEWRESGPVAPCSRRTRRSSRCPRAPCPGPATPSGIWGSTMFGLRSA
jgi:hypothetical protein